jgi:beta-glucosidase
MMGYGKIGYLLLLLILLVILSLGSCSIYYGRKNHQAKKQLGEVFVLIENDYKFRDLNKNGRLDPYEDRRQPVDARISDLISQLTLEEKAGLMFHPPIGVGKKGQLLGKPDIKAKSMNSTWDLLINKKINHFNLIVIPGAKYLAEWSNALQKLAEQSRLGIPVTISSDPRHGLYNFLGPDLLGGYWSKWPEPIGLAAIGDSSLVAEFGRIVNAEYRAVGIRVALHPMADLATEPRWARINGTFGEDAGLSAKLVAAYIYGLQGDTLGKESVACMTKHWPGAGPQEDGEDAHFSYGKNQVYPGHHFNEHLIPFEAAIKAGTAMMMPYYGVPVGQTGEDVGMSFNKAVIDSLLRRKYGFDGVVCTDWGIVDDFSFLGIKIVGAKKWGVENLTVKERIKKALDAGIDQFGGNDNTEELVELVQAGEISEARIDESVRRILKVKFLLGLFDNPYVDTDLAEKIINNDDFREKGEMAQRKSIVLLENDLVAGQDKVLPLKKGVKIYVENIDEEIAGKYATVVKNIEQADFAVLRINAPYEKRHGDFVERKLHQGSLDFPGKELDHIRKIASAKPVIICIYLDRPAILTPLAAVIPGLLCDFGASDNAALDVIFGDFKPVGRLPVEIPSSMEAVENQKEDLPFDSKDPQYNFGYGLGYE